MTAYEYKTIAAPRRARRARGVKGPEALLAHAMGEIIAAEAIQGWDYVRADSLPVEEGGGLFSKSRTTWRAVLVFRRERAAEPAPARTEPARTEPARAEPESPEPYIRIAETEDARPESPGLGGARRD